MAQGITPTITPTLKQHNAWQALRDANTRYVVFGGGAGGGKSWLGAEWLLTNCYVYPGTKWFIGREELKRLMSSTFLTFVKVCAHHKIPQDWKLNGQYNFIEFKNGSRIDLLDLKYLPSDPLYERFGSLEYTGGWIDEAGEVNYMAVDVLKTRVGRHLNDKYNLLSKTLYTCNPSKDWLYRMIYLPFKAGTLPPEYAFIRSLYSDNWYASKDYEQNLKQISDPTTKERLMFGNWEYSDDPSALMLYDSIIDVFTNSTVFDSSKYLSVDVARFGSDKSVIGYWRGLTLESIETTSKLSLDVLASKISQIARDKQIPFSQIIVDEDGVGGGMVDILRGVKGFVGNSTPLNTVKGKPDNFQNLRTQCYYALAEAVNSHQIAVKCEDQAMRGYIIQELEQVKSRDNDKDGKRKILSKDDVKELIGRSPDYSDMMMMRMWFELRGKRQGVSQYVPGTGEKERSRVHTFIPSGILPQIRDVQPV